MLPVFPPCPRINAEFTVCRPGVTPQIQSAILSCLASWLRCGEISVSVLLGTPLFALSFDALSSDPLFDVAVDVVCDIINETQEIEENMDAIQLIVPRILALQPDLAKAAADEDDDKVRGLCRVFVQAAETYHHLILRHRQECGPLVEAVSECASYSDLDIVQITFRFWYLLATDLGRISERHQDPSMAPMLDVYKRLLDVIVKHLRFPDNLDTLTGQERDDFRSFRHYMGDTLKDCCHVLGSQPCLARSLAMIQDVLQRGASGGGAAVAWQDVEAPLFSMRAMGAEADPRDDDVVPKIIDLIPSLPQHPKLNYAALLVVSRYTEWVDHHPDRIPGLLSFISAGFSSNDVDVMAAASQAMNYMCQDCKRVSSQKTLPAFYDQETDPDVLPLAPRSFLAAALRILPTGDRVIGARGPDEHLRSHRPHHRRHASPRSLTTTPAIHPAFAANAAHHRSKGHHCDKGRTAQGWRPDGAA